MTNIARIEERIDRVAAGNTAIDMGFGGVKFATLLELMEFAKLMAVSGSAIPAHLRGNPGTCLAICTKAMRFGFDPFALAEHSFTMVKSTKIDGAWEDVETIAYDSFVVHAIIEAHGEVTGKLRPTYEGEGDARRCTCTGVVNGEALSVTSATLGEIKARIGRNDKGKLKGSPLWDTKPDQQLWYDTRRDWCRAHQPHILLGWYDKDELQEHGGERARDVTPIKPTVADRLKGGNKGRGFSQDHVETQTASGVIDETATTQDSVSAQDPSTPPSPSPEATPATTAPLPEVAGDNSQTLESSAIQASDDVGQADGATETSQETRVGLPEGWEKQYALALRRATKEASLSKLAGQFWAQHGGWNAHYDSKDGVMAGRIYDAFSKNFGNKAAIDAALKDLEALP